MDLKSFYKKIDVDNIKSRLPPLPQIKIPKIKSRKIFKSSREDISQQQPPGGTMATGPPLTPMSLPPPSAFIDRTPTRISTVSSLMNMNDGFRDRPEPEFSTYRTASNFEAEHCPDEHDGVERVSGNAATRFGDKCKKTYKDLTEFRIKNLFVKKTVVKKTEIEVDVYARQYERELQEELELENNDDDTNYEFEFKEARRLMSRSSGSISPPDSDRSGVPSPLRSELGHLQKGETPPLLGRRRYDGGGAPSKSRLQRSVSEESANEPPVKPNRSSLWGINENQSIEDAPESQIPSYRVGISKLGAFRKSRKDKAAGDGPTPSDSSWSLKSIRTRFAPEDGGRERKPRKEMQAQDSQEDLSESEKRGAIPRRKRLQRRESVDKTSEVHVSSPEGKFSTIKQSIKRLKQRKPNTENVEHAGHHTEESELEQTEDSTKSNMSSQLRAGLRRLKMRERSISFDEEESKPPQPTATSRLRDWKKSLKLKRPSEATSSVDEEEAKPPPAPPGRSLTLMRKLNQIRSRKAESEDGDQQAEPSQGDDQRKPKLNNLERLEQARDKALKKVNAQVQKMKKFQGKSRDSPAESSPEKPPPPPQSPEKKPRRVNRFSSDESPEGEMTEYSKSTTTTVWTTKKLMSQSLESEDDVEVPRVLIHQDNSDQYESTLIIAVTRPAPPAPSPIIKEIPPRTKPKSEWIPNKNAVSSFLEMTPSPPPVKHLDVSRGHFRKRSMDSNDSDSWIPDNFRNKSCTASTSAGLNKITESSEPWKVHSVFSEEKLYKTKSIDIFSKRDDSAFEDFDDELKNVPIRRIAAISAESIESTDDDDDYDNSSRITRLKRPSPLTSTTAAIETQQSMDSNKACRGSPTATKKSQIGNSRESLDASYDDISTDDDDAPPSGAPSPPPSFSPPPPPLPLRKPPKNIPERNDSMVRLAKPLVKQASLRRHFSEDIEPADLGKVNKLISRFEKNPSQEHIPSAVGQPEAEVEVSPVVVEEKKPAKPKEEANNNRNGSKKRPAPIPQQPTTQKADDLKNNNKTKSSGPEATQDNLQVLVSPETPRHKNLDNASINSPRSEYGSPMAVSPETPRRKNLDNASIKSPRSEYGSPMGSMYFSENVSVSSEYGSPIGNAFPPKTTGQLHACRRLSNRSSLRDDDTFYSFESDEENNFYSFGESSSSARHTIEI